MAQLASIAKNTKRDATECDGDWDYILRIWGDTSSEASSQSRVDAFATTSDEEEWSPASALEVLSIDAPRTVVHILGFAGRRVELSAASRAFRGF